ncbi:tetratricopeptide repeat-containing sulfotransferase family protein [Lacimicrobium alkaliphilum]|uniref:Sulfotransferase n=1 Tax=Lacimicrobium alkaliphilum TaxID=1526571 RepID=A0ABQ1R2Y4_9ALTE|nr:sulfotransferase [Lacimicrobium alkaliphilum]GGD56269.1 sulfotransferase [Lacimicrobium alkaliphilum]
MLAEKELNSVVSLCRQGQWQSALALCLRCHRIAEVPHKQAFSQLLADIYRATGQFKEAEAQLSDLARINPDRLGYTQQLAELYKHQKMPEKGISCYQQFMLNNPDNADAYFNLALLYKEQSRPIQAEEAYNKALALNIAQPEEVHTNLAVLYSEMRREEDAKVSLKRALEINPDYVPALFNLATLFEEFGDKPQAKQQYQRLLKHQPSNTEVLARLVQCDKVQPEQGGILQRLTSSLKNNPNLSQLEREAGYFALGKGYDDLRDYATAFNYYSQANALCSKRLPPYKAEQTESQVTTILTSTDNNWVKQTQTSSDFEPVFICGMFRSGTTLLEQILSAHPMVTSGGELSVLKRCVEKVEAENTEKQMTKAQVLELSTMYQKGIEALFPEAKMVTDKRPDNFWHLGVIRSAFPKAKIICTDRHPLDICLSVYFQHLGNELPYNANMEHIAHYYMQYKKLLKHFKELMPDNLICVDYQQLVMEPEDTMKRVLEFCGLPWSEDCMQFHKSSSVVKTASVWQVRQPLYMHSLERWRNYESYLSGVREIVASEL